MGDAAYSGSADDPVLQELDEFIATRSASPGACRDALRAADEQLAERFRRGEPVSLLVRLRATIVDRLLTRLWQQHGLDDAERMALIAVGGYGRGELLPGSDVDILILVSEDLPAARKDALSEFVTGLWDSGLEIGHSVRSVAECQAEAAKDVTVATTLMESRLLAGPASLYEAMNAAVSVDHVWPSDRFFVAKRDEQIARHHRYDDTAYKLEPNVKGSPGGLRDIQMISWVATRHTGAESFEDLVTRGFLTRGQLARLRDGREFLLKVRFGLHILTGRREDRLLFDLQARLAELLGYEDATYTLAVEQLMQRYYRTVMDLSRLNEMLLQLFEEDILVTDESEPARINDRFLVRNGFLQTTDDSVFARDPSALLELFLVLQQHPEVRGVGARTIGLIKRNLHLIDEEFRQNPRNHRLFLSILRAQDGVTHELRRMNRYGVLGLYIPAFGRIVGRMQYDLFHAYTVDEHTLFVVSNLRRFALQRFDHEFPACSRIMQALDRPEVVYLAGLFHDIAKGRGGDHSELGAVDAEAFCLEHGMGAYDARTVAWLVLHHLALSMTAQKKDIGDPEVINEFAALVGDQRHLDCLYLLTVADVRGTNPSLWNSWKATLFGDLYNLTSRALRAGGENPIDRDELIRETREGARALLSKSGIDDARVDAIWKMFPDEYFLRHRAGEIAWHTEVLDDADPESEFGFVEVRKQEDGDGVEVVLYTPHKRQTFALATGLLTELGLTIVDARIVPISVPFSVDTYICMEADHDIEIDEARLAKIRRVLSRVLTAQDSSGIRVTRRASRQVRLFSTPTEVHFSDDRAGRHTVMEITAADRPGLLSAVGRVFVEQGVHIETAKILTIGEKAEDVFHVADAQGRPLSHAQRDALRAALTATLENEL